MIESRPNPIDRHVGARIRDRRAAIGMTADALAARVGLTLAALFNCETGTKRIRAALLFRFAQALGVPASWFFHGAPPPSGPGPCGGLAIPPGALMGANTNTAFGREAA